MKVLILMSVFGLAVCAVPSVPILKSYHEDIGIPEASRIKAMEDALDFFGSRIYGGERSPLGHSPHLAGLVISLEDYRTSVCGATVLSHTKLITAAHCWYDGTHRAYMFEVVLGSTTLFQGGHRLYTDNVILHYDWDFNFYRNDLALISVPYVTFDDYINLVALPSGELLEEDFAGVYATAAGFGMTGDGSEHSINYDQVQSHVDLTVITNEECYSVYGQYIVNTTLCTDGKGRSTCSGDSGGPLVLKRNEETVLIGVASFQSAYGCTLGYPSGFSRITEYIPWITSILS